MPSRGSVLVKLTTLHSAKVAHERAHLSRLDYELYGLTYKGIGLWRGRSEMNQLIRQKFVSDIKSIITQSRETAIRSVDFQRVVMYWHIGKTIFEEEQRGQERAGYGEFIIRNLAGALKPELGSGFSSRILELSRQFYRTYPIANTLRSQLSWSQ